MKIDEPKKEQICKNGISSEYSQVINKIGLENAVKLAEIAGGSWIYIPCVKSLERPYRNYQIRAEFNGYNYKELAQKYGVSANWIREIVAPKEKQEK